MRYSAKTEPEDPAYSALQEALEAILRGLELELIELTILRHKGRKGAAGAVQVRLVIFSGGGPGSLTSVGDCSRAHHAIVGRLELAFPESDLFVEVSSPGIDRLIKDGAEAARYRGRGVRCYRTDISDWQAGILVSADEKGIELKGTGGIMHLDYEIIAKAKLYPEYGNSSQEA